MSVKKNRFLYIDSSVLVSIGCQNSERSKTAMEHLRKYQHLGSSELSVVEAQAGLSAQLGDHPSALVDAEQNMNQIFGSMTLYSVDSLVLRHARALVKRHRKSIGLRSLDAIHVATFNLLVESYASYSQAFVMEYITADRKQHAAFTADGHIGLCLSVELG
jgi:predicted nucleic acid-binding protein